MMDNILAALLIGIAAFLLGLLLGLQVGVDGVKADCAKLGAFYTRQIVYDCKERK